MLKTLLDIFSEPKHKKPTINFDSWKRDIQLIARANSYRKRLRGK